MICTKRSNLFDFEIGHSLNEIFSILGRYRHMTHLIRINKKQDIAFLNFKIEKLPGICYSLLYSNIHLITSFQLIFNETLKSVISRF